MTSPLPVWFSEEHICVQVGHEILRFPASEPSHFACWLRSRASREEGDAQAREERKAAVASRTAEWNAAMARKRKEVRAAAEKLERDKEIKRQKAKRSTKIEEFFKEMGL